MTRDDDRERWIDTLGRRIRRRIRFLVDPDGTPRPEESRGGSPHTGDRAGIARRHHQRSALMGATPDPGAEEEHRCRTTDVIGAAAAARPNGASPVRGSASSTA
jgi:hypothetical protein